MSSFSLGNKLISNSRGCCPFLICEKQIIRPKNENTILKEQTPVSRPILCKKMFFFGEGGGGGGGSRGILGNVRGVNSLTDS